MADDTADKFEDPEANSYPSYVRRRQTSRGSWLGWGILGVALAALLVAVDMRFRLWFFVAQPHAEVADESAVTDESAGTDVAAAADTNIVTVDEWSAAPVESGRKADAAPVGTSAPLVRTSEREPKPASGPVLAIDAILPEWGDVDGFIVESADAEPELPTAEGTAKVTWVHDGDTIDVLLPDRTTARLRLRGIDAPESDQPFGEAAKRILVQTIAGRIVRVKTFGEDSYERTIADIIFRGRSVNLELVRAGYAWHYKGFAEDRRDLDDAERAAKAAQRGLWGNSQPAIPPWEWRQRDE